MTLKLRTKLTLLVFVVLALPSIMAQTFVKEVSTGTASGIDWDNALGAGSLKTAIEAGGTIYIAEGTYSPPSSINLTINVGHFIQGGFPSSATGTDLSGYDPNNNPTIIDGGSSIQLLDNGSRLDTLHLTGLTLQNASGLDGSAFQSDFNNTNQIDYMFTDLVVQNCVSSGLGAIMLENKTNIDSKISFTNCSFMNNTAGDGGAIYMLNVYTNSSAGGTSSIPGNFNIDACTFDNNTSTAIGGGAIMFRTSHAWTITNSNFCNNIANNARGGAINFLTSANNVLDNCFFSSNITNEFGGAIYGSFAVVSINNSTFVGNSASFTDGGAISASNSSWQLDHVDFYNNTGADGGAIKSTSYHYIALRSSANNCLFYNNESVGFGTIAGTNGGGALCIDSLVNPNGWDIDSCIFVNNKATAASWGGAISQGKVETTITNSLFYNNTMGGNANISGSDIKNYDNTGGFYIMSGNKMQLANAAAYTNQSGATDASSYAFTDDTFSNADDGSVPPAPASPCLDLFNISGTIFEDINYGGGNGRVYNTSNFQATNSGWSSGDIGVNNVRIELYDGTTGAFIKDTVTNASGDYTFLNLVNGNYTVRVVNNTITSNRSSNATGEITIPVQTFRSTGTSNVNNEVGGANPSLIDTTANTTSANISTLTSATAITQSKSVVVVNDAEVLGVDFGFNFDVIVNTNDSGQGSLRQFILNSNELSNTNVNQQDSPPTGESFNKPDGWEVSLFMIPGAGPHVIQPLTQLPFVEDSKTHITGYTQDGAVQGDIPNRFIPIELDGNTTTFDALTLRTDSLQVSGLSIHDFRKGLYTPIGGTKDIFIWGNYIGMEADGITPSSNNGAGLHLYQLKNSFVGTNGDNVNDANEGNLISNSTFGLHLVATDNILIAGNFVGTDKTGLVGQGNTLRGFAITNLEFPNYIGFKEGMPNSDANQFRNIISGNTNEGLDISNSDSLVIAGNYIGLDALGTGALLNTSHGIEFLNDCNHNIVGTNSNGLSDAAERNIIVGNTSGVRFSTTAIGNGNKVSGNFIGTDHTGFVGLSVAWGIQILGASTNLVIGTNGDNVNDEVEFNLISGNSNDGIVLNSTGGSAIIAGNIIGLASDGITPLGNGRRGIYFQNATSNVTIGWSPSMANTNELIIGNQIKHNTDSGIGMTGTGVNNRFSRNQISNNGGLGIAMDNLIGDFSVEPNDDGDIDTGVNNLLNFPVIDSVYLIGDNLTIKGFAPANTNIEFYVTDSEDNPNPIPPTYTSSFGEGALFIDAADEGSVADTDATASIYTDDGTGSILLKTQNRFEFTFDVTGKGLIVGTPITSLAIDPTNNTSEFGNVLNVVTIPDEICNNGIDDDGDGDIDCVDGDCSSFDTDGDLICDVNDLDDDNDGIPDLDEGCQTDTILIWNEITPAFGNVSNGSPSANQTVTYTNEAGNFEYTFVVNNPGDNYFSQFSIGTYHALGLNPIALDSLEDFIELTMNIDNLPAGVSMDELFFTIDDLDNGSNVNTREFISVVGYDGATPISPTVTAQQSGFLVIDPPAGDQSVTATTTVAANLPFLPGNSNPNGTAEQGAVDILFSQTIDRVVIRYGQNGLLSGGGIGLRQIMGTYCIDTDGDGVVNSLDLDSDNDGIYDLNEASHPAIDANIDGIIDGAPSTFGANGLFNGVETVSDNGILSYTIADSEATPDGNYDAYELDADGDTCFDALEENVSDLDNDGIAGFGIPTVIGSGLVNTITYGAPPNDVWQNPLQGSCLSEICDDGIDNNVNGSTDEGCCDAVAPLLTKD